MESIGHPSYPRQVVSTTAGTGAGHHRSAPTGIGASPAIDRPSPTTPEGELRLLLDAAIRALAHATADDPRGVVILDRDGEPAFLSSSAARLIAEFLPEASPGSWPLRLRGWLRDGRDAVLVVRRGRRSLRVRRDGDVLILVAVDEAPALTRREQEILACVARGMTNRQVATMLTIAPSTVRTHLEHVYAKLGVSTRTGAVTAYFGDGARLARMR